MISKTSHQKYKFQKIVMCFFTVLLISLPSFNLFGIISIQNSHNFKNNNNIIENSIPEKIPIEKEYPQDLDLKILNKRIQVEFGSSSSLKVESEILLYTLGLLNSLVLVNIGVVIKKNEGKTRKEKEALKNNYSYSTCYINEKEKIVLNSIQDYLNDNKQLEIDKVINHLNSKFAKSGINLNSLGIKWSIKSLLDKKFIVEGSKLTREDILENPNRNSIFEYIKEKPGAHLMKIVRDLNMSNFLVRWHLDMLLKFNYIKCEKINNQEIYYDISMSSNMARFNHLIMNDKSSKILRYLQENNKGITKYQITKNLGMHYNTITKYITELEKYGIIFKKECKSRNLYFLNF